MNRNRQNLPRKFTDEEFQEVVRTFDPTREDVNARFSSFMEDMHADKRNLSLRGAIQTEIYQMTLLSFPDSNLSRLHIAKTFNEPEAQA